MQELLIRSLHLRRKGITYQAMKTKTSSDGYEASYKILESCKTFEEYLLKFAIEGLDEKFCYTAEQFESIRWLFEKYFSKLK